MSLPAKPLRILLSAYACDPNRGSEPGVGWNWAMSLVRRGHEVWVLTRSKNRASIEDAIALLNADQSNRLKFIYYDLPRWAMWWKKGGHGVHLYYAIWQRNILSVAKIAHSAHSFNLAHHLTFGVWRQPSSLYKLGIPVIFGPVGGGETATPNLVRTLPFAASTWERVRYLANLISTLNPSLRKSLKETRWVVAKTKETSSWIRRAGAHSTTSFEIGIDAQSFQPKEDRASATKMKCLFAGRLIGLKGVHLAIKAVASARALGGDVSFTIVGKGPMRQRLEDLTKKLGVSEHIHFIDWLDQSALFEQYRQHDVLLFPSLHDSSGNVILEAFAHGLPAICLNLGGPGEMVDSTTGIVVEPTGDPVDGLAKALTRLATDAELCIRLGNNARAKANVTSWDKVIETVYEPVEKVVLL